MSLLFAAGYAELSVKSLEVENSGTFIAAMTSRLSLMAT